VNPVEPLRRTALLEREALGPAPPLEEWTPAVEAWFGRYEAAVDYVGDIAGWDRALLMEAAGPNTEDIAGRDLLRCAAICADQGMFERVLKASHAARADCGPSTFQRRYCRGRCT
jgi:hypothetical protein